MFEVRIEPQRFVDEGDRVLVLVHDRGRVKESGDRIDAWWIHLWTLSGGIIAQWEVFPYDEVLSLEAAGLRG